MRYIQVYPGIYISHFPTCYTLNTRYYVVHTRELRAIQRSLISPSVISGKTRLLIDELRRRKYHFILRDKSLRNLHHSEYPALPNYTSLTRLGGNRLLCVLRVRLTIMKLTSSITAYHVGTIYYHQQWLLLAPFRGV
jgi:hypothetical protein